MRIRFYACLAFSVCVLPASAQLPSQTILHPDRLAGPWQAFNGAGGTVGLALEIQTTVPGRPASLDRQTQNLQSFFITFYRTGSQPGAHVQRNVYSLESTFWDGRHLRLHSAAPGRPGADLNLLWHPAAQTFTGRFVYADFDKQVTLRRPIARLESSFAGTWFQPHSHRCLHLAGNQAGLSAWSDTLQVFPEPERYANGLQPPKMSLEVYGRRAEAEPLMPDRVSVELNPEPAVCCSVHFLATLAPDRNHLIVASSKPPAGPFEDWLRIPGQSCTVQAHNPHERKQTKEGIKRIQPSP